MFAADEVFFASTTLWTYSVVEVAGKPIAGGAPGPIAGRLKEILYADFIRG
jgi:branched-subunit amino acid aminotransferase/4-amino-4-deoxychorismate lyase